MGDRSLDVAKADGAHLALNLRHDVRRLQSAKKLGVDAIHADVLLQNR